jgi:single-strand DNA-binding protein
MAKSFNSVTLLGNLGRDPELKSTSSGTNYAKFSIATTGYKAGGGPPPTYWHNCVAWGKVSEIVAKYAKKGDRVLVTGELQYSDYTAADGSKRQSTTISVRDVVMLGGKNGAASSDDATPDFADVDKLLQAEDDNLPF